MRILDNGKVKSEDEETSFLLGRRDEVGHTRKKQISGCWIALLAIIIVIIYYTFESKVEVSSSSKATPHIVMFVADDQGWNDVGYQSTDLYALTPHLDRLVRYSLAGYYIVCVAYKIITFNCCLLIQSGCVGNHIESVLRV